MITTTERRTIGNDNCQNNAEVKNSPSQHTKLGFINEVVVITESVEIKSSKAKSSNELDQKTFCLHCMNDNRSKKLIQSRAIVITSHDQIQKKSKPLSTCAFIY